MWKSILSILWRCSHIKCLCSAENITYVWKSTSDNIQYFFFEVRGFDFDCRLSVLPVQKSKQKRKPRQGPCLQSQQWVVSQKKAPWSCIIVNCTYCRPHLNCPSWKYWSLFLTFTAAAESKANFFQIAVAYIHSNTHHKKTLLLGYIYVGPERIFAYRGTPFVSGQQVDVLLTTPCCVCVQNLICCVWAIFMFQLAGSKSSSS